MFWCFMYLYWCLYAWAVHTWLEACWWRRWRLIRRKFADCYNNGIFISVKAFMLRWSSQSCYSTVHQPLGARAGYAGDTWRTIMPGPVAFLGKAHVSVTQWTRLIWLLMPLLSSALVTGERHDFICSSCKTSLGGGGGRNDAIACGTALQGWRSPVRFPVVSLDCFFDINLPPATSGWLSLWYKRVKAVGV